MMAQREFGQKAKAITRTKTSDTNLDKSPVPPSVGSEQLEMPSCYEAKSIKIKPEKIKKAEKVSS